MKVVTDLRVVVAKNGTFFEMKQIDIDPSKVVLLGLSSQESNWIPVPEELHISALINNLNKDKEKKMDVVLRGGSHDGETIVLLYGSKEVRLSEKKDASPFSAHGLSGEANPLHLDKTEVYEITDFYTDFGRIFEFQKEQ